MKTAKALFELADIQVDKIKDVDDFEDFVAELEATEAIISEQLFKYWTTNQNLRIQFKIDKKIERDASNNQHVAKNILDIRVHNSRVGMSLPLRNRSKGFNWFFSFLVWFQRIQEDAGSNYVLLLDEPGLNLHASAQADLLRFIESLKKRYQVMFTTHSPFMVDPNNLNRVRTIVETESGSLITDTLQQKDPRTLFPLQAALGYDIAQNLYVSQRNLLVEGISDLVLFRHASSLCESAGLDFLDESISIVPVGGLEKVATFVSLLRGSELGIAAVLDTPTDQKVEAQINRVIREKLIHDKNIKYFHEFASNINECNLEDMLEVSEYLQLFNIAFNGKYSLKDSDLQAENGLSVIKNINNALSIDRFNHYLPAKVAIEDVEAGQFSNSTLKRFALIFKHVNGRLCK